MSNILIIGANRGLGLEFVKQYSNTNHNIIATTRNKDNSPTCDSDMVLKI